MKKLLSFWRWIVGAAIGLGTISLVTYQQHTAAEKYKHHREEYCSALFAATKEQKSCIEERTNASDYLPWGYELLRWPEGITAWAIILTGFAIAWQSWETRKAAKATRDAIILQHRPKIVVRSLTLTRDKSSNFEVLLVIRNSGSNLAHLSESKFSITWLLPKSPSELRPQTIKAATLKPGETLKFKFTEPEFYIRFEASRNILEDNPGQEQTIFLGCVATLSYTDGIGTRRDTAINRVYDYRKAAFIVSNLESDYSD